MNNFAGVCLSRPTYQSRQTPKTESTAMNFCKYFGLCFGSLRMGTCSIMAIFDKKKWGPQEIILQSAACVGSLLAYFKRSRI